MRLVESKPDDHSPETGKTPWVQWEHLYPLWGWVDIDLDAIGAPVIPGEGPPPNSRDPITPGVLVYQGVSTENSPAPAPVLLVGTNGQTRNPVIQSTDTGDIIEISSDGSGIGLKVKKVNAGGFKGTWSEYGIIRDGRGTFRAVLEH